MKLFKTDEEKTQRLIEFVGDYISESPSQVVCEFDDYGWNEIISEFNKRGYDAISIARARYGICAALFIKRKLQ